MQKYLIRIVKGAVWLYLVLVGLLLMVSLVYPDVEMRGIGLSMVNVLLFLAFPVLIAALLLKAPRLIAGCVLAVIIWGLFHIPYLISRSPHPPDTEADFTVLTFNLQAATEDLDVLVTIIEQTDADLVALQELSVRAGAHLTRNLRTLYPHIAFFPRNPGNNGMGVMSRYPITAQEFWRNQHIDGALGNMRVVIDLNGTPIALYNIHPRPPISFTSGLTPHSHSAEIDVVMARVAAEPLPTLIVGDFNMSPWLDEYPQIIDAGFEDSYREAGQIGFGFTFPSGKAGLPNIPMLRLDYIFYDKHFRALASDVWSQSGPSDHLPLWTALAFAD